MDLWIRSQDKECLRKINALYIVETNDKKISIIDNDYNTIAFYNSRERALEVLDEIEERIMLINTFSIARDTDSLLACQKAFSGEKIQGLAYPYEMPEK